MQIEWKSDKLEPFLCKQFGEWPGVHVHWARVMPGRMIEHKNAYHEVNVAINGSLVTEKVSASGKRVVTRGSSGNLCVTPAGQSIAAHWDEPIENMGFSFDPQFISKIAAENNFSPNFEFIEVYKKEDALIQNIGLTLLAESRSETPSGKVFTDSLIQTLTLHLLTNYSTTKVANMVNGGLSGYKVRRVKEFIAENLEDDLNLSEIAAVAELSQYHFARAFRKTIGLTPQQYVMRQRIEKAKLLLSNADLPLVEVSLRTGFKNQSHFTTLFRKFTKFTPKTWRDLKLA
ncbi:MAG: helix-turn-helix transcriptional regulator [Acidobacteria bacterium]|nr:helix-turn-helix transcriptional regulator [Acidobacteriota bacterium]